MISELYEKIIVGPPAFSLSRVWDAYAEIEDEALKGKTIKRTEKPKQDLILLVSTIRKAIGIDQQLTAYDKTVDKNFQDWVFKKQSGKIKFSEEQMSWLRMIKNYVTSSFHLDVEDFELDPFNKNGGLGKFYQVFGEGYEKIIEELNEVLAA